jgi:hypothetical protein
MCKSHLLALSEQKKSWPTAEARWHKLHSLLTNNKCSHNPRSCDCVQRFPLNFFPYIPLTCHVSVLFPPISLRSTAVPLYQTSIPHHTIIIYIHLQLTQLPSNFCFIFICSMNSAWPQLSTKLISKLGN